MSYPKSGTVYGDPFDPAEGVPVSVDRACPGERDSAAVFVCGMSNADQTLTLAFDGVETTIPVKAGTPAAEVARTLAHALGPRWVADGGTVRERPAAPPSASSWTIDYLNPPSPPPPVYVDVPGVPGNAAFARAWEALTARLLPGPAPLPSLGASQESPGPSLVCGASTTAQTLRLTLRGREVTVDLPADTPAEQVAAALAAALGPPWEARGATVLDPPAWGGLPFPAGRVAGPAIPCPSPEEAERIYGKGSDMALRIRAAWELAEAAGQAGAEGAGAMTDGVTVRMGAKSGSMQEALQAFEQVAQGTAPLAPAPAPGQVWAPPPGAVPAGWLAADGTLTVANVRPETQNIRGTVRFAPTSDGSSGSCIGVEALTAPRGGWRCLGVVTPHGRVMVGDGFVGGAGYPAECISVGLVAGEVTMRFGDGSEDAFDAAEVATWTRTRYAPARPGERYLAGGGYCAEPEVIDAATAGRRFDARAWERVEAPSHSGSTRPAARVDHVTVTLGDREHVVPVRPGESPEEASRRFLAGRLVDAALLIEDARLALGQVRADRNGGRVLLTGRDGTSPHRYRVSDGDALRDQYVSVEALPTRWPFVVEDGGVSRAAISARLVAQRGPDPKADSSVTPTVFTNGMVRTAAVAPAPPLSTLLALPGVTRVFPLLLHPTVELGGCLLHLDAVRGLGPGSYSITAFADGAALDRLFLASPAPLRLVVGGVAYRVELVSWRAEDAPGGPAGSRLATVEVREAGATLAGCPFDVCASIRDGIWVVTGDVCLDDFKRIRASEGPDGKLSVELDGVSHVAKVMQWNLLPAKARVVLLVGEEASPLPLLPVLPADSRVPSRPPLPGETMTTGPGFAAVNFDSAAVLAAWKSRWHIDATGGLPTPTPPSHLDALSCPDATTAPPDPEEAARRYFAGTGERSAPRALTGWAEARHPWQMRGR